MDHRSELKILAAADQLRALLAQVDNTSEDPKSLVREVIDALSVSVEDLRQEQEDLTVALEEVQGERDRYEALFELAPDGYVVTSEDGTIKEANRAASAMLGAPKDLLVGRPLVRFVIEADQGVFFTQLAQLRARGRSAGTISFEVRMRARSKGEFFAAITAAPIYRNETMVGLRWSLRDITLQRRTEHRQQELLEENQQQRAFLERLMDTAPVGIAVVRGEDHRYEMANAHYRAMASEPQTIIGRPFAEVFPEVADNGGVGLIEEVYQTATVVSVHEWSLVAGTEPNRRFWNVDLIPLWESDGSIQGVLIVSQEVTPQVRARREIEQLAVEAQQQADQLSTIFDAMSDTVLVYDKEGIPVRANPKAVEVYGLDPVGVARASIVEILKIRTPEGDPVPVESLPSSRALQGGKVENARYRFQNVLGEERTVIASAAPMRSGGTITGAVVVWRDITEQK
jgi:PAS domain S-box-containing protein